MHARLSPHAVRSMVWMQLTAVFCTVGRHLLSTLSMASMLPLLKLHTPIQCPLADTTPAEAESRALLEEAMAMASGEDVPIRIPARPVSAGLALSAALALMVAGSQR